LSGYDRVFERLLVDRPVGEVPVATCFRVGFPDPNLVEVIGKVHRYPVDQLDLEVGITELSARRYPALIESLAQGPAFDPKATAEQAVEAYDHVRPRRRRQLLGEWRQHSPSRALSGVARGRVDNRKDSLLAGLPEPVASLGERSLLGIVINFDP